MNSKFRNPNSGFGNLYELRDSLRGGPALSGRANVRVSPDSSSPLVVPSLDGLHLATPDTSHHSHPPYNSRSSHPQPSTSSQIATRSEDLRKQKPAEKECRPFLSGCEVSNYILLLPEEPSSMAGLNDIRGCSDQSRKNPPTKMGAYALTDSPNSANCLLINYLFSRFAVSTVNGQDALMQAS